MLDIIRDMTSGFVFKDNPLLLIPIAAIALTYTMSCIVLVVTFGLFRYHLWKDDPFFKFSVWYVPIVTLILIPICLLNASDRELEYIGLKTEKKVKVKPNRELPSNIKNSPLLKD